MHIIRSKKSTALRDVPFGVPFEFQSEIGTWFRVYDRAQSAFNPATGEIKDVSGSTQVFEYRNAVLDLEPGDAANNVGAVLSRLAALLKDGKKIEAIKEIRAVLGLGLKDAKELIDCFEGDKAEQIRTIRDKYEQSLYAARCKITELERLQQSTLSPPQIEVEVCGHRTYTLGGMMTRLRELHRDGLPLDTPVLIMDEVLTTAVVVNEIKQSLVPGERNATFKNAPNEPDAETHSYILIA